METEGKRDREREAGRDLKCSVPLGYSLTVCKSLCAKMLVDFIFLFLLL